MEDIMFSYPVFCDDNDCNRWHIYHVWSQKRGYSVADECGDHESMTAKEYRQLFGQHDQMWSDYAEWVIEHGEDPLDNYFAKRTFRVEVAWTFRVANVGAKPVLVAGKPAAAKQWKTKGYPKEVADYLNLQQVDGNYRLMDFETLEDLLDAVKEGVTFDFAKCEAIITASIPFDLPNRNYKAELREIAKTDLISRTKATAKTTAKGTK